MADPHPKSPEWRVIEHAMVKGFLSPAQLDQARNLAGEHPGQEDAALLRVVVRKFTAPEHVDLLRAYYEEQKEVFKQEAAEAEIEVLSISDILVRPVLEIDPDSGRFRQIPIEEAISGSDVQPVPMPAAAAPPKWTSDTSPTPAGAPAWDVDADPEAAPLQLGNFEPVPTPASLPAAKPPEPVEQEPKQKARTSRRGKKTSARRPRASIHAPESDSGASGEPPSMVIVVGAVVAAVLALGSALYMLLG